MYNVIQLSTKQLNKLAKDIDTELKRRATIVSVENEITDLLQKKGLSFKDLRLSSATSKLHKSSLNKPKTISGRSLVEPKYFNPNGDEKWSGRGRPPIWVNELCQRENLSIQEFKMNGKFLIRKA